MTDTKRLRELAENIIGTEFESEDFNSTLLVNHVDYNGEQHFGFEMKKSIRDFISQANPQVIIALIDELEKAKAQLADANAVAEFYAKESSWYLHKDHITGAEVRRSIELFDTESEVRLDEKGNNILMVKAGKRARQYLEKYKERKP